MRRILTSYFVAMMLMFVLVGCSAGADDVVVPEGPETEGTPLKFAAYVGRSSRDGATVHNIADEAALAEVGGFGVLGYDQGAMKFEQYILDSSTPNFLVNQQVWHSSQATQPGHKGGTVTPGATGEWQYEPVKYFNNNPGALHSFFAYAPYDADVEMVYSNTQPPQLSYAADRNIDLLWSKPVQDKAKPGATEKITFNFGHALAKTTFHVAPFIDLAHAADAHPLPETNIIPEGTTIRVRSIHINGEIALSGLLNTATGQWLPDRKGHYYDVPHANAATWTGDGETAVTTYHGVEPSNLLIPTREATIEVIYDVISGEGADKSHITNKAESHLTFALDQGKAYDFYLDLGLTSVKFTAKIVDWTVEKQPEAELQQIDPVTCIQLPWVDVDGDAIDVGL